jgi:hypothetical protein
LRVERSPDSGKGLARDTRIRWALEEVGQSYEVRLVSFRAMKELSHLGLHPFGQIPTYEEESGRKKRWLRSDLRVGNLLRREDTPRLVICNSSFLAPTSALVLRQQY